MPKAKIDSTPSPQSGGSGLSRTPVKINSTSTPVWYKAPHVRLHGAGTGLAPGQLCGRAQIPLMVQLNAWNYVIGFGLFVVGLLMTMGWR